MWIIITYFFHISGYPRSLPDIKKHAPLPPKFLPTPTPPPKYHSTPYHPKKYSYTPLPYGPTPAPKYLPKVYGPTKATYLKPAVYKPKPDPYAAKIGVAGAYLG